MRLHVLSDLHLERGGELPARVDADVVVLAGDVGRGTDGVRLAAAWCPDEPVLYVAGNHEPYGGALPTLTEALRAAADGTSVRVLEDDELVLDGVRFLGCTLWSAFSIGPADEHAAAMAVAERVVNDYTHVRWAPEDRPLRAADTLALHERSRAWLAERLAEPHDGPTVVVTHHAPVAPADPPGDLVHRAVAGAFTTDLRPLMRGDRAALWIYGHTHRAADLDVAGTRVLSNPRGYPDQLVEGFDPALVAVV